MSIRSAITLLFTFICFSISQAQPGADEQHAKVVMRMIGHQLLLNAGDSTSVVLPIENVANNYMIQFDTDLAIDPGMLSSTVDSIMQLTQLSGKYIVRVEKCGTAEVVYSYEVGYNDTLNLLPCRGRKYPEACYKIWVSLESETTDEPLVTNAGSNNTLGVIVQLFSVLGLIGLVFYSFKERKEPINDPMLLAIGSYRLNTKTMQLATENEVVELTSKEADLLLLLHSSVNHTIEREVILKEVWGDEGDYVGRTLDVFISKLRKKLEADPRIKIINARGVGYKLVVDE